MRYPEFLKKNGRIGFIAPSFGCATEPYKTRFLKSLEAFRAAGYETVLGPNAFACEGIGISNTPEKCAGEANDFFLNDRSDVIISCGGGELMCETLNYMNFDKIAQAAPKWFMGYSDNTNFTFLLNTLCDTAAIYGPCAGAFMSREDMLAGYTSAVCGGGTLQNLCTKKPEEIKEIADTMFLMGRNALRLISGEELSVKNYDKWFEEHTVHEEVERIDFTAHEYKQYLYHGDKAVKSLDFSGRLLGGCLDCLANIVGTKFDKVREFTEKYKNDGIIWFLESCELNVMSQARAYWNLANAGWFENVKAFIIGRPLMFDDTFDAFDHYKAALHMLSKYNVPIIMDADIGHLDPAMPLISGAYAQVKAEDNSLSITHVLT